MKTKKKKNSFALLHSYLFMHAQVRADSFQFRKWINAFRPYFFSPSLYQRKLTVEDIIMIKYK